MERKKSLCLVFHSSESRGETAKRLISAIASSLADKALSDINAKLANTNNRQR